MVLESINGYLVEMVILHHYRNWFVSNVQVFANSNTNSDFA